MSKIVKACVYCKYCEYEEARWYSALTGGDDEEWRCGKGKFSFENTSNMIEGDIFLAAITCEHFEPKDSVKKLIDER